MCNFTSWSVHTVWKRTKFTVHVRQERQSSFRIRTSISGALSLTVSQEQNGKCREGVGTLARRKMCPYDIGAWLILNQNGWPPGGLWIRTSRDQHVNRSKNRSSLVLHRQLSYSFTKKESTPAVNQNPNIALKYCNLHQFHRSMDEYLKLNKCKKDTLISQFVILPCEEDWSSSCGSFAQQQIELQIVLNQKSIWSHGLKSCNRNIR